MKNHATIFTKFCQFYSGVWVQLFVYSLLLLLCGTTGKGLNDYYILCHTLSFFIIIIILIYFFSQTEQKFVRYWS